MQKSTSELKLPTSGKGNGAGIGVGVKLWDRGEGLKRRDTHAVKGVHLGVDSECYRMKNYLTWMMG